MDQGGHLTQKHFLTPRPYGHLVPSSLTRGLDGFHRPSYCCNLLLWRGTDTIFLSFAIRTYLRTDRFVCHRGREESMGKKVAGMEKELTSCLTQLGTFLNLDNNFV